MNTITRYFKHFHFICLLDNVILYFLFQSVASRHYFVLGFRSHSIASASPIDSVPSNVDKCGAFSITLENLRFSMDGIFFDETFSQKVSRRQLAERLFYFPLILTLLCLSTLSFSMYPFWNSSNIVSSGFSDSSFIKTSCL